MLKVYFVNQEIHNFCDSTFIDYSMDVSYLRGQKNLRGVEEIEQILCKEVVKEGIQMSSDVEI